MVLSGKGIHTHNIWVAHSFEPGLGDFWRSFAFLTVNIDLCCSYLIEEALYILITNQ